MEVLDDDPEKLFESLGEVSEEQWEAYKELRRVGEGLICSDESEVSSESDGDEAGKANMETSISKTLEGVKLSSGESSDDETKKKSVMWEPQLTVKYIDGEITFDEFAVIMERTNQPEEEEEDAEKTSTSLSESEPSPRKASMLEHKIAGEKFEEEFQQFKKKPKRRRRGRLPKDLQGLMGEANLCFVRGEREDAIKMCMEVIRLVPRAAEPFQTLGMIYEEMGDMEKAFQFSLIGAYLSPHDPEEWVKLAQMSLEKDNVKMATTCYTQALRADNSNINLHWERAMLYERQGEKRKALVSYEAIVRLLPAEQGEECMQLCREVVKLHHEGGNVLAAINVLEKTAEKCSGFITSEDINMLLELQISQKYFLNGLKSLRLYCGVSFEGLNSEAKDTTPEEYTKATKCIMPDALAIDLQAKLAVLLIQLSVTEITKPIVESLLLENVEEAGDLFLDIAEAYMNIQSYKEAITLLEILIASENYNLAGIWLCYGNSLHALKRLEDAAKAYQQVVTLAPTHGEARLTLASLLKDLGRTNDAIFAVQQDYKEGNTEGLVYDGQLLFESCRLLCEQKLWKQFVPTVKLFFSIHCYPATTPAEIQTILNCASVKTRYENLKLLIGTTDCSTGHPEFINDEFVVEELWEFYIKTWKILLEMREFEVLHLISIRLLTSKLLSPKYKKEIKFMALLSCYYGGFYVDCYSILKDLASRALDSDRTWNFFGHVIALNSDLRHNRFCLRLMLKNPEHKALSLLNGHTALISGSYKSALAEYISLYTEFPEDPYLSLLVGITFSHISAQKFSLKRHSLVAQSTAFLQKYWKLRGDCQEVFYNLGRAMHGLGLNMFATYFYKKALQCPPSVQDSMDRFDLAKEIAYNLSLIYRLNGSSDLARMYLRRYCVV